MVRYSGARLPERKKGSKATIDRSLDVSHVVFTSSWLHEATWNRITHELTARFKDGFIASRAGCTEDEWHAFATSNSPGSWWHRSRFM